MDVGVGTYWGRNHPLIISEPVQGEDQTNNRAELLTVLRGL